MKYYVEVQKSYYSKRNPEYAETVQGIISVHAPSAGEAIEVVDRMMNTQPVLQTNDRRIKWEATSIPDPVYEDFTFETTGAARAAEDHALATA